MAVVDDPLERLLTPAALEDPSAVYADLRDNSPVYWHQGIDSWIISRFDDCVLVMKDDARFACDERRFEGTASQSVGIPVELLSLQSLDPPESGPLRSLLARGLRAQISRDFERNLAARVERAVGRRAGREFDFVAEFTIPIVLGSIEEILGVEPMEPSWFSGIADAVTAAMDSPLRPELHEPGIAARGALSEMVEGWFSQPPSGGLLGYLAKNRDSEKVDRRILVNSVRAILHAGYESMSSVVNLAMAALLDVPGGLAALPDGRSDPALQELVRFTSPVRIEGRVALADTVLHGQRITAGSFITMIIGAANRDPARFERPEELDLARTGNPHLGLGRGPHACIGTQLALTQMRVVFATLARLCPTATLVGRPDYRGTATIRGIDRMVVAFD
ncbi:cytochrome P450 [Actinomadura kijaniata]|uniref:cytochrome P450 n=1 Tax=Actinomadura kijaniata TaxID=46161 RepID=UPI000AC74CA8|nr:cytochrome P450 [Actinomadura kijaniata]